MKVLRRGQWAALKTKNKEQKTVQNFESSAEEHLSGKRRHNGRNCNDRLLPSRRKNELCFCLLQLLQSKNKKNDIITTTKDELNKINEVQGDIINVDEINTG